MALELKRLVEKVEHMDITLLAGGKGIRNLVSWVHMVETIEASSFLEGGEIACITGIGLSKKTNLLELIEHICEKKAAAVIVNTGPFIEVVSSDVIDFCNAHDFPVYAVPWKIHLAEIMRIFCFSITKDDQRSFETAAAFKNAIFFPKQEELYAVALSQNNFRVSWKYTVAVLKLKTSQNVDMRLEKLKCNMENCLKRNYDNFAIFIHESELIAVLANYDMDRLKEFINEMEREAKLHLIKGETVSLGVGRQTKSIRCLYKSYGQAKDIQKLQMKHKINSSMLYYSDLGIYRILMGIEDKEIISEYYNHTLRPLIEYDNANDSDLTKVLRCYLENDGSVKKTSDEMYVHRNTINYKLGKIGDLLQMDLSSLNTRLELLLAFKLSDML